MIGRIVFLSAAAFVAYRYISKSNQKAKELREARRGDVAILPPESVTAVPGSDTAPSPAKALVSPAAEDLSRRY